jgi:spore coat-associated protein N
MVKGFKRKMIMALATTAMGASLIAGGSYALFTDEDVNAGNTFSTGKLSINANKEGTGHINITKIAPGDTGKYTFIVQNDGDYDVWVKADSVVDKLGGLFDGNKPLKVNLPSDIQEIPSKGEKSFEVTWEFPREANNDYQDKDAKFGIKFMAVQSKNNTNKDFQ